MTTAYANDPMCAPTSMTMSVGSKRTGRRYSFCTTTPLKIIRSSVPRRNVHPSTLLSRSAILLLGYFSRSADERQVRLVGGDSGPPPGGLDALNYRVMNV